MRVGRVALSALLSGPEIRAQCGSSARWDLCGGRLAQLRVNRPYRDQFDAAAGHFDEYHTRLENGADEAIECVLAVMRELDKLHGTESFEKCLLAY